MTIDEKMIEAANDILTTYDPEHLFTRQELIDLIHTKYGVNETSILPSSYCYNRTNNGVRLSTPKLFLHMGRGQYKCVGPNYDYSGPVLHETHTRKQRKSNHSQTSRANRVISCSKEISYADSIDLLAHVCGNLFDLAKATLSNSYYYSALPLCVIDAVFSIGGKYTSTLNTVLRYSSRFNIAPYNYQRTHTPANHTISDFICILDAVGVNNSATTIYQNHQRTSSRNGILKAEAVYRFAKILQENGIESFADLNSASDLSFIGNCVKQIPGQKSGLSWQYFLMLAGDDSLAKPDRHVIRFIEKHLGFKPTITEAQQLLTDVVSILSSTYPNITVRLLDYTIWDASAHNKL